ncbi:MAG TPA: rhodanese-like domain-containing protein [Acidimicrobiia bacterium]|nr:rhodanese-like domain-containing protein [Acidimicrobiia bacterium]
MEVVAIRTPSLGDTSYLVHHGGVGVAIDVQRDIGRVTDALERTGVTLVAVLETHVHNDYISGAPELARLTGADLVLPAGAGVAYPNRPAFHMEDIDAGGRMTLRPLHTPGHTLEHTSYLVLLDEDPVIVFTGGSLLVGSAGRTDLLGDRYARSLARLQHGSLQRLAQLPDAVAVRPTHGGGSFCTASNVGGVQSTIGEERAGNPLLSISDPEAFADRQLSGHMPYPTYYAHMGHINRDGPPAFEDDEPPELSPEAVEELMASVGVVDGRPQTNFAAGHIAGSIGVELGDRFAPWVGWLVPFGTPLVLVLDPGQDGAAVYSDLARIGYGVAGVLRGVDGWADAGLPLESHETAPVDRLAEALEDGAQVVDVRDPAEWESEHLPGSIHRYVPDLINDLADLDRSRPVWVVCATGFRASIAAGLLLREGLEPIVVNGGGVSETLALLRQSSQG